MCSISIRNRTNDDVFVLDLSGADGRPAGGAPDPFDFQIWHEHFERAEHLGVISRTSGITFEREDDKQSFDLGGELFVLSLPKNRKAEGMACIPLTAVGRNFSDILSQPAPDGYVSALRLFLKSKRIAFAPKEP